MTKNLSAEIISIGTEILLGEIVDTNATYLSERLRDRGIVVYRKTTIGDNLPRLVGSIKTALSRSDMVIMTGGLGPTDDDMTREAICEVVGEKPFIDDDLMKDLTEKFKSRGRPMPDCNNKQAWLIKGASALDNEVGTAPGWFVEFNGKYIVALPGPPTEMTKMWAEEAEQRLPASENILYHITIHTAGIGESHLAEKLAAYTVLDNPGIGTYARQSGVDVRIATLAPTKEEAKKIVDPVFDEIKAILEPWIFGYDDETLVSAIAKLLINKKQTFVCIESVTGGMMAAQITDCPGVSACFRGSITAYANDVKNIAGVPAETIEKYGAVSAETALAMAQAARKMLKADWALATTGVAGPDSLEGKKPGTAWIAIAGENESETVFSDWPGTRYLVRNRICRTAFQNFFKLLKK